MRKIIIGFIILVILLLSGCKTQPSSPNEPIQQTPVEEPLKEQQVCTEMWLCKNSSVKAYRKSDCTFEKITGCPAGCEMGECREVIQDLSAEIMKNVTGDTKKVCSTGWKCMDKTKRGYQFSNCIFTQVDLCIYGCSNGECISATPEEAEAKEKKNFSLKEGIGSMKELGWKSCDFSEGQVFEDGVYDPDIKIMLYALISGYNYFRVETTGVGLWIITKGIADASRDDCIEKIKDANGYNYLRTGQTACIQTKEKDIAMIGGYWDGVPKEDTKLSWKYYITE